MFNINLQGILKDAVKAVLKIFNISNFNFNETVFIHCIQLPIPETHKRFGSRKMQAASKFKCFPCTEAMVLISIPFRFQYMGS